MGETIPYQIYLKKQHFRIDYPYYGLFGSADVVNISGQNEILFECKLLNGTILYLKKLIQHQKWIDLNLNMETSLSLIIGNSIDDFMRQSGK